MIRIVTYIHSDKDAMLDIGFKAGLRGEALRLFKYAATEVKIELLVDPTTGEAVIDRVDDRKVGQ